MITPHPTHEALLAAGLKLAEEHGLSSMTIDQIVREAGVAKGTFYNHFPDRVAFLVELHLQFHEHLKSLILSGIEGLPLGVERLRRAATIYLDGCLAMRAIKALLLEARSEPAIAVEVQRRNANFALLAEQDFSAIGWPYPAASARLFVVMCQEAAIMELEVGRPDETVRAALFQYIGG